MKTIVLSILLSFAAFAELPKVTVEFDVNVNEPLTDILLIVDNSGSMQANQELVGLLSGHFLKEIYSANFKITAVSTDEADVYASYVLNRQIPNTGSRLYEMITRMGTNGSPNEKPFFKLTEFYNSRHGIDFFRRNSAKEIIIISDEDDQSTVSLDYMKDFTSKNKLTVNAVATLNSAFLCPNTGGSSDKIYALANASGGSFVNFCDERSDIEKGFIEMAKNIATRAITSVGPELPVDQFTLPTSAIIDSIRVFYGTQKIPRGYLHTGWVYDELTHQLKLGKSIELSTQPADTKFVIEYEM